MDDTLMTRIGNTLVFFTVMISFFYSVVTILAVLEGYDKGVFKRLKDVKIKAVTTIIKILGIPLIVSMLLSLPDLVVPLSDKYKPCRECSVETKKLLEPIDPSPPESCLDCIEINLKDAPPGYVFVVAMIVIFITLELTQLDAIRGKVRETWSSLLLFSLVLDMLASAIFIAVKYNQYSDILLIYLIALLAFLASFLVIILSKIDAQFPAAQALVEDSTDE